jgi:hypothetical protein
VIPSTRNITAAWRQASEFDIAEGSDWYAKARRLAEHLDPDNVERAAGVIAALSPKLSWPQNCDRAIALYRGHNPGGLPANMAKAKRILAGEHPEDVLGGPKVRAFYFIIVNPDHPEAVAIDRHAFDIAVGKVTDDSTRNKVLGRKGGYEAFCQRYHRAAKIISREVGRTVTAAQVQAVTWTWWRRERAFAYHGEFALAA